MISKNELRLGNYFWWAEVEGFGQGLGQITHPQQIADYADFKEPIPITNEWLENFGFIYNERKFWRKSWGRNGTEIVCQKGDDFYFGLGIGYLREFKYVHQLQNIFFALTQQELVKK